jgi:hypothetical protein
MRRARIELADLASADNLALAACKAARGKRQRPEVRRFCAHFDDSIARLAPRHPGGVVTATASTAAS